MYTVHVAPVATDAQELGRARPSQRRAIKSADPDDVRACGSARIGALMQRPPPARRRAARNPPITAPADPAPARAEAGCMGEGGDGEDNAPPVRAEAGRTWERGGPTGWERVFVGILRICPHCQDWSTRSRVHRPPLCAHGSRRPTSTCVRESRNHAENRHSSWWGPSLPRATLLRSPSERSQSSRGPVSYTAPDHNPSPEAVECPVPGRNAWTASGHLDPTVEITRLSHDARDRRIPFVPDCDSSGHPAASPIPHR